MIKFFFATLVLGASLVHGLMHEVSFLPSVDSWECPDVQEFVSENPDYSETCVESSIPPWPLCLFHGVKYFVDAAVASANRCCDFQSNEDCSCPLKNRRFWKRKMKNWCEDISSCPGSGDRRLDSIDSKLVTEAWTKFLDKED